MGLAFIVACGTSNSDPSDNSGDVDGDGQFGSGGNAGDGGPGAACAASSKSANGAAVDVIFVIDTSGSLGPKRTR